MDRLRPRRTCAQAGGGCHLHSNMDRLRQGGVNMLNVIVTFTFQYG